MTSCSIRPRSCISSSLFAVALCALIAPANLLAATREPGGIIKSNAGSLRVLFVGDNGHHKPADRFKQLQPALAKQGIELIYTDKVEDLNPARLAGFDCIAIYANTTRISPAQEKALLDFVDRGGGFVPIHCASYCFLNSPKYIELVGAQFKSHGTGVFKERIVDTSHPVMQGLTPIESWDETYVHAKHNTNRLILAERRDDNGAEPYTWVRDHGKGRVFYTAWGHDQRTWSNTGFVALIENGIRWASANSPTQLRPRAGLKPFEYMDAPDKLPNYTPNAAWGTQSEPIGTMQKPLDPAESIKHLVTFPEFSASLFASEPDITKPLWLSWDERGRLWIAESVDYPNNLQPAGEGHDRLKICEDTNGDGRADKYTVFCDKLSIPTSFVFANGGVIVIHSGKTEFFKDSNGDDKADERRVLFSGWGMRDTHATASNLRYGFDGWIWGTVGYSGFNGTVGGKDIRFGQGIFRFKPDGSKLEYVRASNNNTWGLAITEDNIIIGSTANGNASMYMPIPNRYYEAVNGWSAARLETIADSQRFYPITEKVRQVDFHGRYTAGSGSGIYTARQFPKEYWNRVQFVAEPTGHLLGHFYLERRGADFIAHNARNFAASDDEWTAPIYGEVGPDGSVWIVDWYNYIVQHNPTPRGFRTGRGAAYETTLRDKEHGRIYRVTYDANGGLEDRAAASSSPRPSPSGRGSVLGRIQAGQSDLSATRNVSDSQATGQRSSLSTRGTRQKGNKSPTLQGASPSQLAATLKNDNLLWRMHAQRLLTERGKLESDLEKQLVALIRDQSIDEIGLNPSAIHALWTLQALGGLNSGYKLGHVAAREALKHPSPAVRRAAVSVLRDDVSSDLVVPLLKDSDAQVRLAAFLALSELPAAESAGSAIFAALQDPQNSADRWIPDAATAAAARNDTSFIRAVLSSYKPAATDPTPSSASPLKAEKAGVRGEKTENVANLIPNSSFEQQSDSKPTDWRTSTHSGRGQFALAEIGHSGSRSAKISSEQGGDVSWAAQVPVKPRTDYKLTGWIKTEKLQKLGNARGALFNIHELQDPVRGATKPLTGDNDWTQVELNFNSGQMREITINCLFGGWGRATGAAWFDDLQLTPAAGSELAGEIGRVVRLITAHYAQRAPVDTIVPTLTALKGASPSVAVAILDGLMSGWPGDKAPSLSDLEKKTLATVMEALPEMARDRLLALAQRWGQPDLFGATVASIIDSLKKQISDPANSDDKRGSAAKRLIGLDDSADNLELVLKEVTVLTPPALATGFINALAESRNERTGRLLTEHWSAFSPIVRRSAIAVVMRRGEWAMALLDAVQKEKIRKGDLAPEHWSQLKQNPSRAIAQRAERLADFNAGISADREEIVKKLLPLAKEKGDAVRGKEVFTAQCANCHILNGQGGKIGPELTGIGSRDRSDILLEILDPNRSVEANYRMWNVTTKGGETFSGRLEAETQTSVEILDITGQKHAIQRKDIATMEASQLSLMPVGMEALPADDLKGLVEYLANAH
jgi:putative membrane-bound dehydrogenase-like protein